MELVTRFGKLPFLGCSAELEDYLEKLFANSYV